MRIQGTREQKGDYQAGESPSGRLRRAVQVVDKAGLGAVLSWGRIVVIGSADERNRERELRRRQRQEGAQAAFGASHFSLCGAHWQRARRAHSGLWPLCL